MSKKTTASLSVHARSENIKAMQSDLFDVVIIGGGITGAGAARDAASRGMKVALIEAQDFAQGTSSRSSKLVHGGIRYLENYEFHLVFEALSERSLLFELAPTLVHPLRFVLPLYKGNRVGMFKMGLGMWAYDALSLFEAPELHERLNPAESLDRLPLLQGHNLVGSYVYSDAYMDDDRLVHETLRSAARLGAIAANHVKAVGVEMQDEKVTAVVAEDLKTGKSVKIRGKHFISTVGPWTDILGTNLLKSWKPILRPSKGVHLTFNRSRFNVSDAIVMAADNDKRIVFGIPRHEMFIIGTTDTDFKGDPADVSVTPDDVKYLLGVAGEYFPGANLTEKDIIASYCGVRPLVNDGSETESKTSREHLILNDPRNITFVAGGKYTTYRRMASEAIDAALDTYSSEDQARFSRPNTEHALNELASVDALERARRDVHQYARLHSLEKSAVQLLVDRHALEIESLFQHDPGPKFSADERVFTMEARHAIRETMCDSLSDFYFRRVPLFLSRADHGLPLLARVSRVFQEELGWSDTERATQSARLQDTMGRELSWRRS